MNRVLILSALLLASCGTNAKPAPEPVVVFKEVKVPVAIACDPDIGPEPAYVDTPEAIAAAPDIFARTVLLVAGRVQRIARNVHGVFRDRAVAVRRGHQTIQQHPAEDPLVHEPQLLWQRLPGLVERRGQLQPDALVARPGVFRGGHEQLPAHPQVHEQCAGRF